MYTKSVAGVEEQVCCPAATALPEIKDLVYIEALFNYFY